MNRDAYTRNKTTTKTSTSTRVRGRTCTRIHTRRDRNTKNKAKTNSGSTSNLNVNLNESKQSKQSQLNECETNFMKIGTDSMSIIFQFIEWKQKIKLFTINKSFTHLMKQIQCWRTTNFIIDHENYQFVCNLFDDFEKCSTY
jgi:hypothetical protein